MSADPTAEHIDAVARALSLDPGAFSESTYGAGGARVMASRFAAIDRARKLLASTDPAVHAALAASLPAEVMLAALVDRGALEVTYGSRDEDGGVWRDRDWTLEQARLRSGRTVARYRCPGDGWREVAP